MICDTCALLVDSVSSIERSGWGKRAASDLTLFGTGEGGGVAPPLTAVSTAFNSTWTSPIKATVSSIGALPPSGAVVSWRRPVNRSSTMLSRRGPAATGFFGAIICVIASPPFLIASLARPSAFSITLLSVELPRVVSRESAFISKGKGLSGADSKRAACTDCERLVNGTMRMSAMKTSQVAAYSFR